MFWGGWGGVGRSGQRRVVELEMVVSKSVERLKKLETSLLSLRVCVWREM